MSLHKRMGPGLLVTAAFIGPGTVTTASAAGANFGFALMWALLFSTFATLVLQEMAARLGLVTGKGLAEAMRSTSSNALLSKLAIILVIAAIGCGNAAYEVGNIAGAALAVSTVTDISGGIWAVWVMTPDGKGISQLFTIPGTPDGFVGSDNYASRGWGEERISWTTEKLVQ